MTVTCAAANYPIINYADMSAWQQDTEGWVKTATQHNAQILLFPEYGSMSLVSLFDGSIQQDIRQQVRSIDQLKGIFCNTFSALAQKYNALIVAPSIPIIEDNSIFNRVFVFSSRGIVGYQDKFFMTRFEDEEWGIQSANPKKLSLFEAEWGCFGIQICYDVEFSLGSHYLCSAGAQVIFAPSCTETVRGATRVHVGARARALENQCYTVVSHVVGNAAWSPVVDINYGFAAFYSAPDMGLPEEGVVAQNTPHTEGWLIQTLDLDLLTQVRQNGQVLNFRDHQRLNVQWQDEEVTVEKVKVF